MLERLKPLLRTLGFIRLPRIENRDQLIEFIDSRASYVSQVTLYTYVKARAGTQYPKLFSNEDFLTSLRIARWHIYGAAVCDLCLFAAAQFNKTGRLDPDSSRDAACSMIDDVFIQNDQTDITAERYASIAEKGHQRAALANWTDIAEGPAAFHHSSNAVFEWAPIADQLKSEDEEIIRNSIHLRWIGVRRDLKHTLVPDFPI
tara:strand:+ start:307 stop:915 length:609 start_codon:yes stop_codon:yes gene_type:complete